MPWVQWRGHRRAQVHVTQAQHEVTRIKHGAVHSVDVGEAIDAANELDVAGAPGRIHPHGLHVFLDRQPGRAVIP